MLLEKSQVQQSDSGSIVREKKFVNKTELIVSFITEEPATVRELQKITGLCHKIISSTINRLRSRGAPIYIAGWVHQHARFRSRWVARWHFASPRKPDKKKPKPLTNAEVWQKKAARTKMKIRASSVFEWCSMRG